MENTIQQKKNKRKIRLLGKGDGWEKAPDNDDFELWGLNGLIYANKKLDRIFMMDVLDEMPSIVSGLWELQPTIDRINEMDIPMVAPYKYEEIPKSEAFPIDEAIHEFGVPYFNNTIAFMICYALLRGVEEIQVYGINQASGTEYFYEKGCVEYWLGIATGMGVRVSINGAQCELLTNKQRYGGNRLYGYNMSYEDVVKYRTRFGEMGIKKLMAPKPGKMAYVGPEKSKTLRTSDILGIKVAWQRFAMHKEGKWVMSLDDCFNLARFALEYKPKRILDLGTGIGLSAAILRKVLPEAEIVSIEQFPKCIEIAKEMLEEYGGNVDIRHSDAHKFSLEGIGGQEMMGYKELPEGEWDMVIIDGPGPFKQDDGSIVNSATTACGDIFKVINNVKEGGIVYIDGRKVTVDTINRFLIKQLKPIYFGSGFAALQRTKEIFDTANIHDSLLEVLEKDNYLS